MTFRSKQSQSEPAAAAGQQVLALATLDAREELENCLACQLS